MAGPGSEVPVKMIVASVEGCGAVRPGGLGGGVTGLQMVSVSAQVRAGGTRFAT